MLTHPRKRPQIHNTPRVSRLRGSRRLALHAPAWPNTPRGSRGCEDPGGRPLCLAQHPQRVSRLRGSRRSAFPILARRRWPFVFENERPVPASLCRPKMLFRTKTKRKCGSERNRLRKLFGRRDPPPPVRLAGPPVLARAAQRGFFYRCAPSRSPGRPHSGRPSLAPCRGRPKRPRWAATSRPWDSRLTARFPRFPRFPRCTAPSPSPMGRSTPTRRRSTFPRFRPLATPARGTASRPRSPRSGAHAAARAPTRAACSSGLETTGTGWPHSS